jgi:hypothetical protein
MPFFKPIISEEIMFTSIVHLIENDDDRQEETLVDIVRQLQPLLYFYPNLLERLYIKWLGFNNEELLKSILKSYTYIEIDPETFNRLKQQLRYFQIPAILQYDPAIRKYSEFVTTNDDFADFGKYYYPSTMKDIFALVNFSSSHGCSDYIRYFTQGIHLIGEHIGSSDYKYRLHSALNEGIENDFLNKHDSWTGGNQSDKYVAECIIDKIEESRFW